MRKRKYTYSAVLYFQEKSASKQTRAVQTLAFQGSAVVCDCLPVFLYACFRSSISSIHSSWLVISKPALSPVTWKYLMKNQKYILTAAFWTLANPVRIYYIGLVI